MRYKKLHSDEFGIDDALVGRLLTRQMPQWAALPRRPDDPLGADNIMIRDLHPGNLLVRGGKLAAVIDWGSLILGDPTIDSIVAWNLLTPNTRSTFRTWVGVDDATWYRGRAWALSIALVALPITFIRTGRSRPGHGTRSGRLSTTSPTPRECRRCDRVSIGLPRINACAAS
jgi:aminoglycoside phosphotransferase (APT) family kinase protein